MIRISGSVASVLACVACVAVSGCRESFAPRPGAAGESSTAAARKPPLAQIRVPTPGELIVDDVYHGMRGVAFDIPDDQRLVVFASDRFNYFLMFPFPRYVPGNHVFEQNNIRLAAPPQDERRKTGDELGQGWELKVCIATDETARDLATCARRGEWSFPDLPEGVHVLDSVRVERQ